MGNNIDSTIIECLQAGLKQPEIAKKLKEAKITPNSLSSVEKHLNKLRKNNGANTNAHLLSILLSRE